MPPWDKPKPWEVRGNPAQANDTLTKGLLYNATPEQSKMITTNLSPDEMEFQTATNYYNQKFGTNHTPEMVTAQMEYEYGEGASAANVNAMNLKAAKHQKSAGEVFGKSLVAGVPETYLRISSGAYLQDAGMRRKMADIVDAPEENKPESGLELAKGLGRMMWAKMLRTRAEEDVEIAEIAKEDADIIYEKMGLTEEDRNRTSAQIGSGIAQLSAMPLYGALPLGVGATTMQFYDEGYNAAKEKGMDEDGAHSTAAAYTAAAAPVGVIADKLILAKGGLKAIQASKPLAGQIGKNVVALAQKFGVNFLSEGASETIEDTILQQGILEEDINWGEKLKTFLISGIVGGVGGDVSALAQGGMAPWSLGDANRTRKQNSNAELAQMVEEANVPAEQKPVMEEMLTSPTEESVEAFNSREPEVAEKPVEAEQPKADQEPVEAEKVPPADSEGALDAQDEIVPPSEEEVLELLPEMEEAPLQDVSEKAQKILGFGEKVKGIFRPFTRLTTRIGEIAPQIKMAIRRADQKTHQIITSNTKAIKTFADSVKSVKKQAGENWNTVKAEILNGDWNALEARGIEGVAELRQVFGQVADALGIKSIENYFRRKVVDYEGLIRHIGENPQGEFERALNEAEKKKGSELTAVEKAKAIRSVLQKKQGSGLNQKRTIETVTPEMAEFYADPLAELENYIRQTAQAMARREFLGIDTAIESELGDIDASVMEDSVADIIARMTEEGSLDRKQQKQLEELLKTNLEYKSAPKVVEVVRRLASMKYVTKLKTVTKQFGDFFVSVGENGFINTMGSRDEAKNWSDEFGKEIELSLEEIGVNALDEELQSNKRKLFEEMLFKPLSVSDVFNKGILAKATAAKWRKLAKSDPAKLKKQLMEKFGVEEFVDGIIADMQAGTMSPDVKFALYSQMADFHPISHSEHIKLYIENPALRPLFILKSFAFTRFDRLYRESIGKAIGGTAKAVAGSVDKDTDMRAEGAGEVAEGIVGLGRFLIFSIGGEALIEKIYKEAMQALGVAPEEIPEDESWSAMYLQELGRVAPFIDPFSLQTAVERKDPTYYWENAHDIPAPMGLDTASALWKYFSEEDQEDNYKWKRDIPWIGEFAYGMEREERERELQKKRKRQIKNKK